MAKQRKRSASRVMNDGARDFIAKRASVRKCTRCDEAIGKSTWAIKAHVVNNHVRHGEHLNTEEKHALEKELGVVYRGPKND
jgi:hypothetical protein